MKKCIKWAPPPLNFTMPAPDYICCTLSSLVFFFINFEYLHSSLKFLVARFFCHASLYIRDLLCHCSNCFAVIRIRQSMKRATSRVMIRQQSLNGNFVTFGLHFLTQNRGRGKKSDVNNSME